MPFNMKTTQEILNALYGTQGLSVEEILNAVANSGKIQPINTIHVAPSGGDYTTLPDAIAAVLDKASPHNRYRIVCDSSIEIYQPSIPHIYVGGPDMMDEPFFWGSAFRDFFDPLATDSDEGINIGSTDTSGARFYLMYSDDCKTFHIVDDRGSYRDPGSGPGVPIWIRDPHNLHWRGKYWVFYSTDDDSQGYGLAKSSNLIDWEFVRYASQTGLPDNCKSEWAPHPFVDADGTLHIFFLNGMQSPASGFTGGIWETHCDPATNPDQDPEGAWTDPVRLSADNELGVLHSDPCIFRIGNYYYQPIPCVKNDSEHTYYVDIWKSSSIASGWVLDHSLPAFGDEAPVVVDMGDGRIRLFIDDTNILSRLKYYDTIDDMASLIGRDSDAHPLLGESPICLDHYMIQPTYDPNVKYDVLAAASHVQLENPTGRVVVNPLITGLDEYQLSSRTLLYRCNMPHQDFQFGGDADYTYTIILGTHEQWSPTNQDRFKLSIQQLNAHPTIKICNKSADGVIMTLPAPTDVSLWTDYLFGSVNGDWKLFKQNTVKMPAKQWPSYTVMRSLTMDELGSGCVLVDGIPGKKFAVTNFTMESRFESVNGVDNIELYDTASTPLQIAEVNATLLVGDLAVSDGTYGVLLVNFGVPLTQGAGIHIGVMSGTPITAHSLDVSITYSIME